MQSDLYRNLISKYIADKLTPEDTEELLEGLNKDQELENKLREMQGVWDKTRDYPEKLNVDTQAAWLKVKRSVSGSNPVKLRKKPGFFSVIIKTWSSYLQAIFTKIS